MLLRKDAAGGNDPSYSLELWETGGASPLATLASEVTLSSETGDVVSATWDASLLGTSDGSAVELVIVGHRSRGKPSDRRTVEVGAVEWNVDYVAPSPYGFYYLRARYYEPGTGRFASRDPFPGIPFHPCSLNRYIYVENNPVNFVDPSGRRHYLPPTLHGEKTEDGDGDRPVTQEEVRTDVDAKSFKDCLWDCYFPDVGFLPGWLRGPVWGAIWASCGSACGVCGSSVGSVVTACEICALCVANVGVDASCVYECVGR